MERPEFTQQVAPGDANRCAIIWRVPYQSSSNLALKCSVEKYDADEADGKNLAQREDDQMG
jgi:hypothetical protein